MYNEFMNHVDERFGTVKGYIRNGESLLAADDLMEVLDVEGRVLNRISSTHKTVITSYLRNAKGILSKVDEVTYLDRKAVDVLFSVSKSFDKEDFEDWIVGEVYPDMRDMFAYDVEEYKADLSYIFKLYETLANKDKQILEQAYKIEFLQEVLETINQTGDKLHLDEVFAQMENL